MRTPDLLPLTTLSHRIYSVILRILHTRLVLASTLESHSLLLECFHPSAKLTEPPYFCTYHGTDGLTPYPSYPEHDEHLASRVGQLRNTYSRFRPHRRELEPDGRRVRGPPGDVPGSRTYPGHVQDGYEGDTVKQMLSLEAHELFTQLVAQANLVKVGPRNGLFTRFVPVEEGVIRVWREWLREVARMGGREGEGSGVDDERILWVSPSKDTGIRFNVRERRIKRDIPILVRADEEDMPVSYEIEYDGECCIVSSLFLQY